jgi:hypothetical protein
MTTMKVTQSENIQAILDERKWLRECKEAYENLIEKYNDKSWKWVPNGFLKDYAKLEIVRGLRNGGMNNKEYLAQNMDRRKTLDLFLELEKTITNPYFFWSLVVMEYTESDFHQDILLEWIDAFTRNDRMELTLAKRQKCVENILEAITGMKAKTENYGMWKALKNGDDIIIYRGTSIPNNTYVRMDKKKLNNSNAHKQDGGLGFSYSTDKDCANFFANIIAVENNEMLYGNTTNVGEIPQVIDVDMINETSKRVVSKHSIKKENILFYSNYNYENEIVALPDDVDLITYSLSKRNASVLHPKTKWHAYTLEETGNHVYSPTAN